MTVLPVLHPVLLLALCLPVLAAAVWALVRARAGADRVTWALRIALVLACTALAFRPGVPDGAARSVATDVDIVIALDNTASMLAEDWAGEEGERRMDGVAADVRAIVAEYPGARFALIAFDDSAQLRLPLTTDTSALMASIEVMSPPPADRASGSSIGIAAPVLEQTLRNAQESAAGRARMVFYLGDGEQTAADEPESFAGSAELVDGGAVLGYGTAEGGRIPRVDAGVDGPSGEYLEDPGTGEPALSRIDESALGTIAEQLGVPYQHRQAGDDPELPAAPAETTTVADQATPGARTELSWILAIAVAVLLLAEVLVASTRIGRTLRLARPAKGGAR
ncbi:VWA domain-containing protein [Microbacterium sp. Marseille-Q6965]|uniref:VWA domain-containing protein n=1 Tax=Microbacterium sp. Marseille-Q6965 TaxID=2965072 RepID=UPI0021B80954|nr:VWA domain-containing protein [Microbacterium sp. Marseille-Q6965]